jgi:prepilin-type N-terminal cleavage/methylation domain-containing protein
MIIKKVDFMKFKAFTMMELLIVMAIVGLLLAAGSAGLLRLQASMAAEQATNQLLSFIKVEQNNAKNNVVEVAKLPENLADPTKDVRNHQFDYVFGIRFEFNENSTFTKSICWREIETTTGWPSPTDTRNCQTAETIVIPGITKYANISGSYCKDIIFENLTEKIIIIDPSNTDCRIGIETDVYQAPAPYKFLNFYKDTSSTRYDVSAP